MRLTDLFIKRPVFATVLNLLVMLLGLVAFTQLSVREYPNIDVPVVTVSVTYRGATAEVMESQITKVIEDGLSGIEGVDYMTSVSRAERSQISITFKLERDGDRAASDIRDRVSRVRRQLPEEVDDPIIAKVEADASPIMYLALSSGSKSSLEVTDIAERLVSDRLEVLDGVAQVDVIGGRRYAMRVWLDRDLMAARNVTSQEVEAAIRAQNVEIPGGRVEGALREFTVLSETDLNQPEQFERIILRDEGGYLVRLRDIGRVELAAEDTRQIARYNGRNAALVGVVRQSTANPLDVAREVYKAIEELTPILAEQDTTLDINYDTTVFIDRSIKAVQHTIVEAVILVIAVIFLFLRSLRATLIPLVTIPVSLIGAFALMNALGFSINTLTLLALVIAIGLVVDDAIVVLENIARHVEEGMSPRAAAFKGAREILFAVIGMTITLAAVFTPVAFSSGRTGQLFAEFALTLSGSVLVSGFTAITLTPLMCALILKPQHNPGRLYRWSETIFLAMNSGYRRVVSGAIGAPLVVIALMVAVGAATVGVFSVLRNELAPLEDRGFVFVTVTGPEGATIDFMDRYARRAEAIYETFPERSRSAVIIGSPTVNQGRSFFRLSDWEDRTKSQFEIQRELQPQLLAIPGINMIPVNPPSLGQSPRSRPVQFVVQTSRSYEDLALLMDQVTQRAAREFPDLQAIDSDLKLTKPELRIDVDRDKAADLGINVDVVGSTLETLLGGRRVTRFKRAGELYEVIVQVEDDLRRQPNDLQAIHVRSASGAMVPLANLVKVREIAVPRELNHFNKLRAATLEASLAPGADLGAALDWLEATVRDLDPQATIDYGGVSREFRESASTLLFSFILALLFIYLVLAAQFESFIDPLIILFSVPLAIFGALLALWLTGNTLNIFSQIGLIALVGLVTKHGILIVEFANQLREQGRARLDALIEASVLRLRPILMTTAAMVLGTLPLALATGPGAESQKQIGWVIVGGLTIGTLLTLIVVPTMYRLLAARERAHAHAVDPAMQEADASERAEAERHRPADPAALPAE